MNLNHENLPGFAPIHITLQDGETITLPSYLDEHGVRRYVSNRVIDDGFNARLFDLNKISIFCQSQNIPVKDRIVFWSMLGYSVDGMCDMSNLLKMDDCKVVTPEWTKDVYVEEEDE